MALGIVGTYGSLTKKGIPIVSVGELSLDGGGSRHARHTTDRTRSARA
ncbi:MAG: hypothetical protein ABSE28_13465 [Candidatus Sulfotelmatobacter sp.]